MSRYLSIGSKLLATVAATFFFVTYAAAGDDAALEDVRAKMSTMFESIEPENINRSPVDGWFTIHQGSIIAYVSEDGLSLIHI